MVYSIPFSILLGLIIISIEVFRKKIESRYDFLLVINIIYVICFCIIPIFMYKIEGENLGRFNWVYKEPFTSMNYLRATIISFFAYIFIIYGYYFVDLNRSYKSKEKETVYKEYDKRRIFIWGVVLLICGSVSLAFYIKDIGGFSNFMKYGKIFRSRGEGSGSKLGFLINLSTLSFMSSYFFYSNILDSKVCKEKKFNKWNIMLFVISIIPSVLILFHRSGRLSLVKYFSIFFISKMMHENKINRFYLLLLAFLSYFFIIFGKQIFFFFYDKDILKSAIAINENIGFTTKIRNILIEFSFPYINLANSLKLSSMVPLRGFKDLVLGFLYLLPKRLLGKNFDMTLSMLNTRYFGASGVVPIDLLSLGYYSFNIAGVVFICFIYGIIARKLNDKYSEDCTGIEAIMRSAWMFFIVFRVMYGDIPMSFKGGFELIVGTIILETMCKKRINLKRREY